MSSILIVDQFSDLGGSQRGLLELLPALADFSVEFALPGPGALTAELERRGLRWHTVDLGEYHFGKKSFADVLRYAARQPKLIAQLTALARGKSIVYGNGPRVFPAAALAAKRAGLPVIWHLHLEIESARDRMLLSAIAAFSKPRVIACSKAVLAPFSPRAAVRRSAVIVYNAVEEVKLPPRESPDGPVIAAIGRLHPDKGLSDLLDAAPEILSAFPEARFRLVGPRADPAFAVRLEKQAEELAPGSVDFTGELPDPAQALAGVDVLVVPSHREAASRVVMEAFSAGVPVVASDAGGLPEVVEGNGFIVPRGNPSMIASAVVRLLIDPELRYNLILAGRRSFESRWQVSRARREIRAEILQQIETPR